MEAILKPKDKDTVVIVGQKEIESQRKIGTIPVHKGHKIYEFDTDTGKLTIAEFESSTAIYDPDPLKRKFVHKLIMHKGCYYVSALNEKNAFRKLNNRFDK